MEYLVEVVDVNLVDVIEIVPTCCDMLWVTCPSADYDCPGWIR